MKKIFYFFMLIVPVLQTLAYNTIDHDYWARILQGDAFWKLGHILKFDPFSYTKTRIWIDHEWGSSVIFSFIQNNFGFIGILIFKTLLVFLIFLLIFKTIQLQMNKGFFAASGAPRAWNDIFIYILLFGASVYAMPVITQSGLRCHFFTFFFFALFLYILEFVRKKGSQKLLLLLPPLFLIWSNMHGGCVSGLGLLFLYAIGEALNKRPFKNYLLTAAASFAVMFINPYGIGYVLFIFTAVLMPRPYVTEWISPFAHSEPFFMIWFKVLFIFFTAVILKNIGNIKADYTKLLILAVCAVVSAKSIKSSPFFIITAFIFLYEHIAAMFPAKNYKTASITAALFFIILSISNIHSFFFLSEQPYKTIEFMRINHLKGRLLAPMHMGSYAAYKLYPDILIYMDGRYEEVYFKETKDKADNFYNVKENWQEILENAPDFIIAPEDAAVNDLLTQRADYKIIWKDEQNLLYSRKDILKPMYTMPSDDLNYYIKNAFITPAVN